MPAHPSLDDLGEPSLELAGLQVWIHGRQFPDAGDADDFDWLRVTAHCGAAGASVFASGAILQVTDILRWGREIKLVNEGRATRASLTSWEPELSAVIDSPDSAGHLRLRVEITPEHLSQSHTFDFEIDLSYLPEVIRQCERVGREYPAAGERGA